MVNLLLSSYNYVVEPSEIKDFWGAKNRRFSRMDKKNIKELSWVKSGKQRREIIVNLHGEQTPTDVAKESGYSLNHASKILNEFKKHGLVKLLNPKERTGRLYELTPMGKVVKDKLREKE